MKHLIAAAIITLSTQAAVALPPASHAYGLDATFADELGGPAITPIKGRVKISNFAFPVGGGVVLNGAVPAETYSIEFRTKLSLAGSRTLYCRLIDFQNRGSDTGLYTLGQSLSFYNVATGATSVFVANKWADITITRNGANKTVTVYVNGAQQISFTDTSDLAVFSTLADGVTTTARFFQDDLVSPGENCDGAVDHVRVFTTVLTAKDARALSHSQLPPNVTTE